ncbi:uncharacterized protein LOC135210034 [Macrobrachium nipponense]|uniref:uncharacterized protein LOC135210034 n=1 Tax=Macrobrachium nipponense TaxID=159736 RepID=UPI0030C8B79C
MARILLVCAAVLLAVASASASLKCLKCSDCDKEPSTSSNCLPGFGVCMKTNVGGKIRKGCAPSAVCKLQDVDRTSINPLKSLKTIFSDHDFKKLFHDTVHAKDKVVHCCETDFCNGSSDKRATLSLLLILPSVLYFFGF